MVHRESRTSSLRSVQWTGLVHRVRISLIVLDWIMISIDESD